MTELILSNETLFLVLVKPRRLKSFLSWASLQEGVTLATNAVEADGQYNAGFFMNSDYSQNMLAALRGRKEVMANIRIRLPVISRGTS